MKSANVTHLLVMDVSTLISFFFMTHAETQGYRPAFGLNSFSVGTFLSTNAPEAQLRNITLVGWLPSWDVTAAQSPPLKENEKLCLSILAKAGQRVDSQVAKGLAFWTCDTLFFLDAAVDRAAVLNPAGLSAAVDALGTAYPGVEPSVPLRSRTPRRAHRVAAVAVHPIVRLPPLRGRRPARRLSTQ